MVNNLIFPYYQQNLIMFCILPHAIEPPPPSCSRTQDLAKLCSRRIISHRYNNESIGTRGDLVAVILWAQWRDQCSGPARRIIGYSAVFRWFIFGRRDFSAGGDDKFMCRETISESKHEYWKPKRIRNHACVFLPILTIITAANHRKSLASPHTTCQFRTLRPVRSLLSSRTYY